MMDMFDTSIVNKLKDNDEELCIYAGNTLMKILNDIIENPREKKFMKIPLNTGLLRVFYKAAGFSEILCSLGFCQKEDCFVLSELVSLELYTKIRDEIMLLVMGMMESSHPAKTFFNQNLKIPQDLQPINTSEIDMLRTLQKEFSLVKIYEHTYLKEAAKDLMPLQNLFDGILSNNHIKTDGSSEKSLCLQELLLLKLLLWFKEEFFEWFDQGYCGDCQNTMKFVGYSPSTNEERLYGGHRVEKYTCETCEATVLFPRYLHPLKLLETRKGRCMEWANCFTLFCRAIGFEARYIVDVTDHAWTEVYLTSRQQWVHIDPSDGKFDKPLMYEIGWKKQLSYIFAFSKDEIVDCVWRYSANHKDVYKRRSRAREDWLAAIIVALNEENQKDYEIGVKKKNSHRLVKEIASFFIEPTPCDGEEEGRISGSLAWRLARGEISNESTFKPFIFIPSHDELERKEFVLKYSPSLDTYLREINEISLQKMSGWKSGIFQGKNVFRKHEKDWKMVYIARTEGCSEGEIGWKFDWGSTSLKIRSALVVFQHTCFEDGVVSWNICNGEDLCFTGNKEGVLEMFRDDLAGSKYLELKAVLKGKGNDIVNWQHSQLFRQKDDDPHFPFFVKLKFD